MHSERKHINQLLFRKDLNKYLPQTTTAEISKMVNLCQRRLSLVVYQWASLTQFCGEPWADCFGSLSPKCSNHGVSSACQVGVRCCSKNSAVFCSLNFGVYSVLLMKFWVELYCSEIVWGVYCQEIFSGCTAHKFPVGVLLKNFWGVLLIFFCAFGRILLIILGHSAHEILGCSAHNFLDCTAHIFEGCTAHIFLACTAHLWVYGSKTSWGVGIVRFWGVLLRKKLGLLLIFLMGGFPRFFGAFCS